MCHAPECSTPVTALWAIKDQADQHKTHSGITLTYEQYCNLLLSAASNYDASFVPKEAPFTRSKTRGVYTHDVQDGEFYDAQELDTASELTYDIDTSVDTLQAHAHQQRAQPKSSSVMLGLPTSRMTRDKWFKLTPEA